MNIGQIFLSIAANLGVSIETILIILAVLLSFIAMARSFQVGIIFGFMLSFIVFIATITWDLNWAPALTVGLMYFVMMALNFYAVSKAEAQGGVI